MYGDGKNTEHPTDAGKFMTAVVSNMDVAKARFESALEQLKNHPNVDAEKIGVIGFLLWRHNGAQHGQCRV